MPTTAPTRAATEDPVIPARAGLWLTVVFLSGFFVLTAVALEVLGGSYANSTLPSWAGIVPLSWPKPARVAWWSSVAVASAGFRLGLHRLGIPQRPVVVAASVLPFVAFAMGVVTGASWSTWH